MNLKYFVIIFVFLYWSLQLTKAYIITNKVTFKFNKNTISNKDDILVSILNKLNQLCNKGQVITSITTQRSTTARLLTISACGCYAVSTCNNLATAAGNRAVAATAPTPCPNGMLYCCPPVVATTATPVPTVAPPTVCACYNVTSCNSLTVGSNVIDLRIVTPECPNGTIYCCLNVVTPLPPNSTTTTMAPTTTTTMAPTTTTTTTMAPTTTTTTMAPMTTTTTMAPTTTTTTTTMAPTTTTTTMASTTTTTMAPTTTTTTAPTTTTTMAPTTTTTMASTTANPFACSCYNVTDCQTLTDGRGQIDFRIVTPQCPAGSIYCCIPVVTTFAPIETVTPTIAPTTVPPTTIAPTTITVPTTTTTMATTTTSTMVPTTITMAPTTTTLATTTLSSQVTCGCFTGTDCQLLTDGRGQIDLRIITPQCPLGEIYCCVPKLSKFSSVIMGDLQSIVEPPFASNDKTHMAMIPNGVVSLSVETTVDIRYCGCYYQLFCEDSIINQINSRNVTPTCPNGTIYCCPMSSASPTVMAGTSQDLVNVTGCGIRMNIKTNLTVGSGQAEYGKYPWIAAILTKEDDFVSTGVLISNRHILTVAHRIYEFILGENFDTDLKVRLGEWDALRSIEPIPAQEFNIIDIVTHPNYNPLDLHNDLAIIEITPNVRLGTSAAINTACLPPSTQTTNYAGQNCWVSGWGLDLLAQGNFQAILREVEVPIIDSNTCQNLLRQTELGNSFEIYNSFLCAGGRPMMDACVGDGGSPLTCQGPNGQWTVVGLVSWGVRCGEVNVPGVYTNVSALLPWITTRVSV